jgi:hypothetical protein
MSSTLPSTKTLTKLFPSASQIKDYRKDPSRETLYTNDTF